MWKSCGCHVQILLRIRHREKMLMSNPS
jgi:hypothetical protein